MTGAPSPDIRLDMLGVRLPILRVLGGKRLVENHKEILRVLFLGGFGEVKAARDDDLPINGYHRIV
jgi:hypothetical protein